MAYVALCCLLLLLHSCIATSSKTNCQVIHRLFAREPDIRNPTGSAEIWNPNSDLFQCAGAQVARYNVKPNGYVLPLYNNAPKIVYTAQGGSQSILAGFSLEFITKAFNINNELAIKLQNKMDFRDSTIYMTGGGLDFSSSPTAQPCRNQDQQGRKGLDNDKDESFCNINTRTLRISDPSRADLFIPKVGYLKTIDLHQLSILESSQLSISYNHLLKDVMRLPH
ncbi:prunin 1 Pru du 6-like [Euphorbia lathyris]|uniref:prunin 1 Pru du 6-like n=1 Tax=Euphorbia lathyris TaxID=212925 RepID=UPI003313C228